MAVLIITHDLGVVANVAKHVVVMYHGQIMESGPVDDIYRQPEHPYLQSLLKAVPHFDMKAGERLVPLREVKHDLGSMVQKTKPWPLDARDQPILPSKKLVPEF